jgi:hypothetical protein
MKLEVFFFVDAVTDSAVSEDPCRSEVDAGSGQLEVVAGRAKKFGTIVEDA